MIIVSIVGTVVGVVVFMTVVSNAFGNAFNKSDLSASAPTPAKSGEIQAPTSANNERGSRENPFAIGQPVHTKDWEITLGTPHEAGAEISAENQFNKPPKPGMQFWIVPVTAT